jgi:hypothetical protein
MGEQVRKLPKIEMCYAWCCLVWFIQLILENNIWKAFVSWLKLFDKHPFLKYRT